MTTLEANPRGIPKAPFVDNVQTFIGDNTMIDSTLSKFQEMINKYKYMEGHLLQRKGSLESKIPEIKETNDMVEFLMKKQEQDPNTPIDLQFELSETLWCNSSIPSSCPTVNLWLGANVMLEYPIEEANELLTSKLDSANKSLEQVDEDLDFLREQITTMEVNIARVYNWDVKLRRESKNRK